MAMMDGEGRKRVSRYASRGDEELLERATDFASGHLASTQRWRELTDRARRQMKWDSYTPERRAQALGFQSAGGKKRRKARPLVQLPVWLEAGQKMVEEAREGDLSIKLIPKAGADRDAARFAEGRLALDLRDSNAWFEIWEAYLCSIDYGIGWLKLGVEYEQDGRPEQLGEDFDHKRMVFKSIMHPEDVLFDPINRRLSDFGSGEMLLESDVMTEKSFRIRYKGRWQELDDWEVWSGYGTLDQTSRDFWFPMRDHDRWIRVARFYETVTDEKEAVYDPESMDGPSYREDAPEEVEEALKERGSGIRSRKFKQKRYMCHVLTAAHVLESYEVPSIPFVPFLGHGERVYGEWNMQGLGQLCYDLVRAIQEVMNELLHRAGRGGRSQIFAPVGSMEKLGAGLDGDNEIVLYLAQPISGEDGEERTASVEKPYVLNLEPQVQAQLQVLQALQQMYREITGLVDAQAKSGDAMDHGAGASAMVQLHEMTGKGQKRWYRNLINLSLPVLGRKSLEWQSKIYTEEGRELDVMDEAGGPDTRVLVKWPWIDVDGEVVPLPGWQPGMPVPKTWTPPVPPSPGGAVLQGAPGQGAAPAPAPPGQQPQQQQPQQQQQERRVYWWDPAETPFNVTVVPGRRKQEQSQHVTEFLSRMTQANQQLAPFWADILFRIASDNAPELRIVADRLKRNLPQAADPDERPEEKVRRENVTIRAQLQQANQNLQQANQIIATNQDRERAKAEGAIRVAQAKAQADAERERTKASAASELKQAELQVKSTVELQKQAKAHEDTMELEEARAESQKQLQDDQQRHELRMQRQEQLADAQKEGLKQASEDARQQSKAEAEKVRAVADAEAAESKAKEGKSDG